MVCPVLPVHYVLGRARLGHPPVSHQLCVAACSVHSGDPGPRVRYGSEQHAGTVPGKVARKATQLGLLALLDALFGAARRFVFQGQLLQEAGREKRRRTDADAVKRGRPSVAAGPCYKNIIQDVGVSSLNLPLKKKKGIINAIPMLLFVDFLPSIDANRNPSKTTRNNKNYLLFGRFRKFRRFIFS